MKIIQMKKSNYEMLKSKYGIKLPLDFYIVAAKTDYIMHGIKNGLHDMYDSSVMPEFTYRVEDGTFFGEYYGVEFTHITFMSKIQEFKNAYTSSLLKPQTVALTYRGHEISVLVKEDHMILSISYEHQNIYERGFPKKAPMGFMDLFIEEIGELSVLDESESAYMAWLDLASELDNPLKLGEYTIESPDGCDVIITVGDEKHFISDFKREKKYNTVAYAALREAFKNKNLTNYWTLMFVK